MSSSMRWLLWGAVLILLLSAVLAGCGKSSRSGGIAPNPAVTAPGGDLGREPAIVTPPEGISDLTVLPERLRVLFNQPVWNSSLPSPDAWTAPEPPEFNASEAIERAKALNYKQRGTDSRNVSYTDDQESGFVEMGMLDPTEDSYRTSIGYNGDPDDNGYDNVIQNFGGTFPPNSWNAVTVGCPGATNPTWRDAGDIFYVMFQLFGSDIDQLIELSYLVPAANPNTDSAFKVEGHNVFRWNLDTGLQENGQAPFFWYEQFVSATDNESPIDNSITADDTAGFIQHFSGPCLGPIGHDYNSAYIIRMDSTDYDTIQEDYIDVAHAEILLGGAGNPGVKAMISVPVFGAIADAYQDLQPAVDGADVPLPPYTGWLGFPLEQMFDFNGGRPMLDVNGPYHLFGQHFFHGFIYWNDYLNKAVNDRVYPYIYTGTTTADGDGEYQRYTDVPIQYGWNGPVGVLALADKYAVTVGETISFYAITWGGGDGQYNDILLNFRDGTVGVGRRVQHYYLQQAHYSVRCMVIHNNDATLPIVNPSLDPKVGVDDVSPILVGTGGGGGGPGGATGGIVDEDEGNEDFLEYQTVLDELGVGYETLSADPSASDMGAYPMIFWANTASPGFGSGQEMDFTDANVQALNTYCDAGGNYVDFMADPYFCDGMGRWGAGNPNVHELLGIAGGYFWDAWAAWGAGYNIMNISAPINTDPNLIAQITFDQGPGWYGPMFWHWGNSSDYAGESLLPDAWIIAGAVYPPGCASGNMHDNNGSGSDGGYAAWTGVEFFTVATTQPTGGTRTDYMENFINYMCPSLFAGGGGGGGGSFAPYEGEFEIVSVVAHVFNADGTFEGGDGSDGAAGFNTYDDGHGTVYHDMTTVPPDHGWVYVSAVLHGPSADDQANWLLRINWRDNPGQTTATGETGIDTYEFRHSYTSGICPGSNAMTLPGYPGNNPTAIYNGSSPSPLYPDFGENPLDAGITGRLTALPVYAWRGGATDPFDFADTLSDGDPRDADVKAVSIGVNAVFPVDVTDYGPTVFTSPYTTPVAIWFQYQIGPGVPPRTGIPPYTVQFDKTYNGLVFDIQATALQSATIGNSGYTEKRVGAAWVPMTAGDWAVAGTKIAVAGIYRTQVKYDTPDAGSLLDPAIRVTDTGGPLPGYKIYTWTNAFTANPPYVFNEDFESGSGSNLSTVNTWTKSGPQGDRNFDFANVTGNHPILGYSAYDGSRYCRWDTGSQQYVGNNAQRWVQTGPFSITGSTDYRFQYRCNGQVAWVFSYYSFAGLRIQTSFNGSTWTDLPNTTLYYGYNYAYQVPAWGQNQLGNAPSYTWRTRTSYITSGPSNTQLWVRFGFESSPYYADYDINSYPNYGGPSLDGMRIEQYTLPAPVFSETWESGIGSWSTISSSGVTWQIRNVPHYYGHSAHGGSNYLATMPQPYPNSSYAWLQRGPITGLSTNTSYDFSFWLGGQTESYWDGVIFQYSLNGSTWTNLGTDYIVGHGGGPYYGWGGGPGGSWTSKTASFNSGASSQFWLRLGFECDSSVVYGGPTVDDITVRPS